MTKVDEKDKEVESLNDPEEWTDDSLDEKGGSWFQQNQRTIFFSIVGLVLLVVIFFLMGGGKTEEGKKDKKDKKEAFWVQYKKVAWDERTSLERGFIVATPILIVGLSGRKLLADIRQLGFSEAMKSTNRWWTPKTPSV